MNKTLEQFRKLALAEGISFLLLLFVAMPLKYMADVKGVVPVIGAIHGALFLGYFIFSLTLSHRLNWSVAFWLLVLLASVFPAGTFLLDFKLKKLSQAMAAQ